MCVCCTTLGLVAVVPLSEQPEKWKWQELWCSVPPTLSPSLHCAVTPHLIPSLRVSEWLMMAKLLLLLLQLFKVLSN